MNKILENIFEIENAKPIQSDILDYLNNNRLTDIFILAPTLTLS